jgi:hypothetical protein
MATMMDQQAQPEEDGGGAGATERLRAASSNATASRLQKLAAADTQAGAREVFLRKQIQAGVRPREAAAKWDAITAAPARGVTEGGSQLAGPVYNAGDEVILHGLVGMPEANGKRAHVRCWHSEQLLYSVQLLVGGVGQEVLQLRTAQLLDARSVDALATALRGQGLKSLPARVYSRDLVSEGVHDADAFSQLSEGVLRDRFYFRPPDVHKVVVFRAMGSTDSLHKEAVSAADTATAATDDDDGKDDKDEDEDEEEEEEEEERSSSSSSSLCWTEVARERKASAKVRLHAPSTISRSQRGNFDERVDGAAALSQLLCELGLSGCEAGLREVSVVRVLPPPPPPRFPMRLPPQPSVFLGLRRAALTGGVGGTCHACAIVVTR